MDRVRLSVALLVDEPEATEINGLRRALGGQFVGQAPPHITLVPPVNVAGHEIDRALTIMRQAAASVAGPLSVTIGPAAQFASNGVLFLSVDNPPEEISSTERSVDERFSSPKDQNNNNVFSRLSELRDRVMRPPLWRHVSHDFVPHVTLRTNPDEALIQAALVALERYRISVTLRSLTLLALDSDGVWSSLADCPLGKPLLRGRGTFVRELRLVENISPDVVSLFGGATVGPQVLEARDEGGVLIGALGFAVETVRDLPSTAGIARHLSGRLISLAVVAEERGFGVASQLVQEVLMHLHVSGCTEALATVDSSLLDGQSKGALRALAARFASSDWVEEGHPDHSPSNGTFRMLVRKLA
jgi:2'-5' RNA ligase/GNAT superfamily N-acetyltransferase